MSIVAQKITYIHPDNQVLFKGIDLTINKGQKVALVGNNGSGKSTFLRILAGTLQAQEGKIIHPTPPYYVPQHFGQYDNLTVAQALRIDGKLEAKEKELRRVRKTAREVAERKQKHESRGEKQSVRKGIPRIMMGGLKENAEKSASKLKEVHEDKMENLANELKQMLSSLPDLQGMKLDFSASGLHEGKILVTAKEINFGYAEAGDLWPSPMSFQIKSGERWLIQGDNGSGKTTLLKLITGQLPPRSGSLIRADFSSIYIDQEYSIVRNGRTVYEQAQAFNERHFQEHEIKTLLNRFLFPHDTWEKSCGKLSGGEKMRLAFCCLMISNQIPDLFILDEPTNNLDIQSIEIITSMVRAYRGTILLISHDAYFIRELGIHQIITTFAGRLKTNL